MKSHHSERGQALVIILVSLIGLLGVTALAVDGGNAYAERRAVQNAADAAVLSGALARIRGEDWVHKTYLVAAANGYDNDGTTNSVSIYSPPLDGPNAGDIEYIQVKITTQTPTYFAKIVGITQIRVSGEAVSRTKTPEITEILHGNAVISLAPTSDCEKKWGLQVSGESTLDITGGGVFVNSDNPDCALETYGNGSIRLEEGETITVVGGAHIQKTQLITPYPPDTGMPPIPYPPPFLLPKVSCEKQAEISADGKTVSSGYWDGLFPPEGVISLQPGAYCLNDDFIVNSGTLEGNGVVIFMEHGTLHFGGGAVIQLTAPGAGQYKNLLIYAPLENRNTLVLNADTQSAFRGTILAPAAEIRLKGNDSAFGFHSQIIGYRIISDGNSNIFITYKDDQNYDALTMPEIQFSQ